MTRSGITGAKLFASVALLCGGLLVAGVIWASGRGFEITDEAYYLLSAIYPERVELYVSAQHWVTAPLWAVTGSLQGFRLIGAAVLAFSSAVLGFGILRVLQSYGPENPSRLCRAGLVAASVIGALAYVATIAPSPSYNLLAAAGAYGGAGFALLAVERNRASVAMCLYLLAGLSLAVSFVSKPSAGVCATLLVALLILITVRGPSKFLFGPVVAAAMVVGLFCLYALQPSDPPVLDSLRNGLELFRIVQSEPVGVRLLRYTTTTLGAMGQALIALAPGLLLAVALLAFQKLWLAVLLPLILLASVVMGAHYLGGAYEYHRQMEAVFALMVVLILLSVRPLINWPRLALTTAALLLLPYAVAIGTGNALFTQPIVSLAPWIAVAAMLAVQTGLGTPPVVLARQGTAALLLLLLTSQILTSYGRAPYHLAEPLTGQAEPATIDRLGDVRVDLATIQMLDDVARARETCALASGADFLGLYNVPGLALAFAAQPPVSPWLNNLSQLEMIGTTWHPAPNRRVILALTSEAQGPSAQLPENLLPLHDGHVFCGQVRVAFNGEAVDIWASNEADGM
ncbi:MAG: hypothetical protein NXH97_23140 [Rhodobacteraceae bacterium]|nr:hypothetical protein [Paracoccaceae bacterium]